MYMYTAICTMYMCYTVHEQFYLFFLHAHVITCTRKHTALLLAYIAGSTVMCDALIRAGAHPGVYNKHGQTIFNVPAATKHLLFRILGKDLSCIICGGNVCVQCVV